MLDLTTVEYSVSEELSSPLVCTPIAILGPMVTPHPLLNYEDEAVINPSKWVSQQMNYFRKHVGVSISGHEPECLALLTKIDKERQLLKPPHIARKSASKGLRELRNLSSSVNYEGKQLSCC